jgi:plastocyanin
MRVLPRGHFWFVPILGLAIAASLLQAFTATNGATEVDNLDWSRAETISIRMEEYRFAPDHLTLRRGIPYRLHLTNDGKEMHEFTAPEFFKAILVKNPAVLAPYGNEIVLQPREDKELLFVVQGPGIFAPTCADHDWAGMKATIIVE